MSRRLDLVVPADVRRTVLDGLSEIAGVTSVVVHPGAATSPVGDVVSVSGTNEAILAALEMLDATGVLGRGSASVSETTALVAPGQAALVEAQGSEAV